MEPMPRATRTCLLTLVVCAACSEAGVAPRDGDVTEPFPIDGDGAAAPATYKGLPLRLAGNGAPAVTAVDGVIGVVCVGMSNANQECGAFVTAVRGPWSGDVNPQVRVANCAVGGHAIERWIDPGYDAILWDDCVGRKLASAGIRPDQVRVLYHKAANQFTTGPGGAALSAYPAPEADYFAFLGNLTAFSIRVPAEFPSVQAVYSSSRSYGGFTTNPGRGEPLSYEEGHALNAWLAEHRTAGGVWHGWGPYLWAPRCDSGVTNGSGTCYERADYVEDGVHPSESGRAKMARLIHERFLRESWYRR